MKKNNQSPTLKVQNQMRDELEDFIANLFEV